MASARRFTCLSAASGIRIATFRHDWVWLDLRTGRSVPIPPEVQEKYRRG